MIKSISRNDAGSFLAVMLFGLVFGAMGTQVASAQGCQELQAKTKQKISGYVAKQFGLPAGATLTLTKSELMPDACVRRLTYSVDWPRKTITLFLSPDQRYFSTEMFDLTETPVLPALRTSVPREAARTSSESPEEMAELVRNAPSRGTRNAPVTIVEFSDFECPYCARMTEVLDKEVLPKEGTAVRLVFKQFPLAMHPWAQDAAEMSECARQQNENEFWRLHDYFFSNQKSLRKDNLQKEVGRFIATEPGIKIDRFNACVNRHEMRDKVLADIDDGKKLGIHGTPTLFVNGTRSDGARSADDLEKVIASVGGKNGQIH